MDYALYVLAFLWAFWAMYVPSRGWGGTDEILWVLADNTPAMVGKTELKEALRLAGQAQTAVWVKPYQPA